MDSRKLPALMALLGVVVAVALFLLLKDDTAEQDTELPAGPAQQSQAPSDGEPKGDDKQPEPKEPSLAEIEIKDGEPVGGVQELTFESGQTAAFKVTSDVDDELHFHGYDDYIALRAGKPTEHQFEADIEGKFELESHTTGVLVAEISVVPN